MTMTPASAEASLKANIRELLASIEEDFPLSQFAEADQKELRAKILDSTLKAAIAEVTPILERSREAMSAIEGADIIHEEEDGARLMGLLVVAERFTPEFSKIIKQEYAKLGRKTQEHLDPSAAADELAGTANDVAGLAFDGLGKVLPGGKDLSISAHAFELLYDPGRPERLPEERLRWTGTKGSELLGKIMGVYWFSLLSFTLAALLTQGGCVAEVPGLLRRATPGWYEALVPARQMATLLALIPIGAAVIALWVIVFRLTAKLPVIGKLFEDRVDMSDLASTTLRECLPGALGGEISQKELDRSLRLIYSQVYRNTFWPTERRMAMIERLIGAGREEAVVAYLRRRVRNYRKVMESCVAAHCNEVRVIFGRNR